MWHFLKLVRGFLQVLRFSPLLHWLMVSAKTFISSMFALFYFYFISIFFFLQACRLTTGPTSRPPVGPFLGPDNLAVFLERLSLGFLSPLFQDFVLGLDFMLSSLELALGLTCLVAWRLCSFGVPWTHTESSLSSSSSSIINVIVIIIFTTACLVAWRVCSFGVP